MAMMWLAVAGLALLALTEAKPFVFEGKLCMTVEHFHRGDSNFQFWECTPLSDLEVREFNFTSKYLGAWSMRSCPSGYEFDENRQRCEEKRKVHRQQAICGQNPTSTGCQQSCNAPNNNPVVGSPCSWQSAQLQPAPGTNQQFMQCAPQTQQQPCGQWVRMPCSPNTQFNPATQICQPPMQQQPSACPQQQAPVCGCVQNQCPGSCQCQQQTQTCCQQVPAQQPFVPQPQPFIPQPQPFVPAPTQSQCPSQQPPICSCQQGCPQGSSCYQGSCCPMACPAAQQPTSFCGSGSRCPQQQSCFQPTQCCCQQQQPPTCPNGQPASSTCQTGAQCGPGLECVNGACCPLPTCPAGVASTGRCAVNGQQCGPNALCQNGLCCPMPNCPDGTPAAGPCVGGNCPPGNECANGQVCCALPRCPADGSLASSRCQNEGQQCGPNALCQNGLCCPMPNCPAGTPPSGPCNNGQCPPGAECINGQVCCALPICTVAQVPSSGTCTVEGEQCGASSICQGGLCCPMPTCPGTGVLPVGPCISGQCPTATPTECVQQLVCCELPRCSSGQTARERCTGQDGELCASDASCQGGLCCPLPLCPDQSSPLGPCFVGQCPTAAECVNNTLCCPINTCPADGLPASGRCQIEGQLCGPNQMCQGGLCCPMPNCPNGSPAQGPCTGGQCPGGAECVNGQVCCALPNCPTGGPATGRCNAPGQPCGPGRVCQGGICCSMPTCPNGQPGAAVCQSQAQCGPGSECAGGVCCPLPTCPTGQTPSQRCTGACPPGQSCQGGVCCPLPNCPSGQPASAACTGDFQCGPGQQCVNGGCCPLPRCPTGEVASQRCQAGGLCPTGQQCVNSVCCPQQLCPATNTPPVAQCGCQQPQQSCGCPQNAQCQPNVGCCPQPLPTCPNGQQASQACASAAQCPIGTTCSNGGCCPLQQPVCPTPQQPVCQCGVQNSCPSSCGCNAGTCCAQPASPVSGTVPGLQCQQASQCNGYSSGCASCVQNTCACTNNAWNNGATCQQTQVQVMQTARAACSPTGGLCSITFNAAKRKPVFSASEQGGNGTNLWYMVTGERHCPVNIVDGVDPDATCLPNEKCINGICTLKLWPGEYGCKVTEECQSRCSRSFCQAKSDKPGVGQCQCKDSYLLFGRCLRKCPAGTAISGSTCELIDEDGFWISKLRQNAMRQVLMKETC